jgi:ATP-dependent exoDNAse (exonuclease V) beta subunit
MGDDSLIKLIIFGVVGLFIVLGKVLSKKNEAGEDGSEQGQPGQPAGGASGPQSPEEALEQMFRQMQDRRKRSEAAPPAQPPPPQARPQTLDEFFERKEQEPPSVRPVQPVARPVPVAQAVPMARPVPAARTYREPTVRTRQVMRKPAPPRVMLRRPKAAFATPEGPTLAAEQRTVMAESKVRRETASAQATQSSTKAVQGREDAKAMISLAGAKFDRAEAAKAMVYVELLGPPRALSGYQGPPAAG